MYINELKIKIELNLRKMKMKKRRGGRRHIEPLLLLQVPPL